MHNNNHQRNRALPCRAILFAAIVSLLLTHASLQHHACALSIKPHRTSTSRSQHRHTFFVSTSTLSPRRVRKLFPTSTSYYASIHTYLASSDPSQLDSPSGSQRKQPDVSETVSSSRSDEIFTASAASPALPIYNDGTTKLPTTSSATAEPSTKDRNVVPMNTPARQSIPSHFCLRPMPGKGLGVIALKPIAQGEFVGEYKGEVMSKEVKDRRYLPSLQDEQTEEDREWIQSRLDRDQTLTGCYLYGIDDIPPTNNGQIASRIYVDAEDEYHSLWTRFINHASLPFTNVHPKIIHDDGNPRVCFLANRNIKEGEEICIDYGDDYWLEGDDVL